MGWWELQNSLETSFTPEAEMRIKGKARWTSWYSKYRCVSHSREGLGHPWVLLTVRLQAQPNFPAHLPFLYRCLLRPEDESPLKTG